MALNSWHSDPVRFITKSGQEPKFGHIIELSEDGGEHTATTFRWAIFLQAGDPRNPEHAASYQGRTDVSPLATPVAGPRWRPIPACLSVVLTQWRRCDGIRP